MLHTFNYIKKKDKLKKLLGSYPKDRKIKFFFLIILNLTKISLFYSIIIGVIITICCNNWISIWIGLEISIISFIPIIQNTNNQISSESIIKYFIVQRIASTAILISVISILIGVSIKNEIILIISIIIKIGVAPFHNWILTVIEYLSYNSILIILTIIKIPPLSVLFQTNTNIIEIPVIIRIIIRSISCLNQRSIKKIIAFSSIYGISLILTSINKFYISFNYLILYSIIILILIKIIQSIKINYINQILLNEKSLWIKLNLWINILSIRGFPLTIGFSIKIIIIQNLIINNLFILSTIMVITSILIIVFYIRLAFLSLFTLITFKKWILNYNKSHQFIFIINIIFIPLSINIIGII